MTTRQFVLIASVIAALSGAPVQAQDTDDIGPGVDTSAPVEIAEEPAVETSDASLEAAPAPRVETSPTRTASTSRAVDSLELGSSQIIGNQELPQVLYIVPWKSSDLGDLVGRPVNTLLDEVLAPADREVFIRQIDYYDDLHGTPTDDAS